MLYVCLNGASRVVAVIEDYNEGKRFCSDNGYCFMPFNLSNKDGEPCPTVGSTYKA